MATKSINEMSFSEKAHAVRNPEITPVERNEVYNAWAIDAVYEKVFTFVKQHSLIDNQDN